MTLNIFLALKMLNGQYWAQTKLMKRISLKKNMKFGWKEFKISLKRIQKKVEKKEKAKYKKMNL